MKVTNSVVSMHLNVTFQISVPVFVSRMVDQLLFRMKGKNQDEVRGESVVMPSVTCYANHGFTAFVHLFNQ